MDAKARRIRVAKLSVCSNTILVGLKLVVGILTGSVSVISEAIHSGLDLTAAGIALFAVRRSVQPPDENHQFGHGKFENLSGTIEALLILVAAVWIMIEAIERLLHPQPLSHAMSGVLVMLVSGGVNQVISTKLFKVGKETDSMALQADAWHLRTDVYTSLGVMAGLAVIWVGGIIWPGVQLDWIDPVAAIAVALLILKASVELTITAGKDLLDVQLPSEETNWITAHLSSFKPVIRAFHRLRTRKAGPYRFVECHIYVDSRMSVEQSHALTHKVGNGIRERYPQTQVTIHVEPCNLACPDACLSSCLMSTEERSRLTAEAGLP
jgi:cation diffusion facilitator family transporter